jgi:tRNA (guanine37-N1)-methyltransferase
MASMCLKTPLERGEAVRSLLKNLFLLDSQRKIVKDGDYLYIPVKNNLELSSLAVDGLDELELIDLELPERPTRIQSYRELLVGKLTDDELERLPRAFDHVGHVALIKIPDDLRPRSSDIGNAILEANKHIRSVYHNAGVHDTYRVMELEHISGEDDSVTTHTEFGIRLELDLKKAYFSPRLATERHRIANLVQDGEVVVDMFAGVGPFSVMIARLARALKVYSIDINPEAVSFIKRNIQLNSAENVEVMEGDAKKILESLEGFGTFHRIIMNLPHSSYEFLPCALSAVKVGGTIHYYEILENSRIDERADSIKELGLDVERSLEISNSRIIHTYSPGDSLTVFDINVTVAK